MKNSNVSNTSKFSSVPKKQTYTIALIIVLASEFILRDLLLPENPSDIHIGTAIAVEWLILLILLFFWIPKVEGNDWRSIGFGNFKQKHIWVGILTFFILLMAWMGSYFALTAVGLEGLRSLQPMIKEHSLLVLFSLFFTGTFLEEIFYRGYLIERLTLLTGKSWLAGITSWITFTFVHLKFFGLGPTLDVSVLSAGLVILYLKERSVWPCIVVHGINGAFSFLIAPLFII